MPCRSDHMEPTLREKESVRVLGFLKELGQKVGQYDKTYGEVEKLDIHTAKLCELCQTIEVKDYSLELQIWWRDHQEADKKRIKEEYETEKNRGQREKALAKLTSYERKLLGL